MAINSPVTYSPVTSAVNARILFDGYPIGELQDFTANESYNVREVYECGSNLPTFVPGFFSGSITSKKAFIDVNMFFTKLQPMSTGKIDSWLSSLRNTLNLSGDFIRDNLGTLNKLLVSYGLDAISESMLTVSEQNLTQLNLFDIEVRDPFDAVINAYYDCIIDSRKMSITTGAIIVYEDLIIKYRRRI